MEINSTYWIPDITEWWCQQEEMRSTYSDLSNAARNIFSIGQHGVGVEASFSLGWDVIGWRQSKITGRTVREKVFVMEFSQANDGLLAGDGPALDTSNTDNDSEMKREAEQMSFTE